MACLAVLCVCVRWLWRSEVGGNTKDEVRTKITDGEEGGEVEYKVFGYREVQ